jgi:hypothetical protein
MISITSILKSSTLAGKILISILLYLTMADHHSECVFIEDARKQYLDGEGNVDWDKVEARWLELRSIKISLGNKFFTKEASQKARGLEQS